MTTDSPWVDRDARAARYKGLVCEKRAGLGERGWEEMYVRVDLQVRAVLLAERLVGAGLRPFVFVLPESSSSLSHASFRIATAKGFATVIAKSKCDRHDEGVEVSLWKYDAEGREKPTRSIVMRWDQEDELVREIVRSIGIAPRPAAETLAALKEAYEILDSFEPPEGFE